MVDLSGPRTDTEWLRTPMRIPEIARHDMTRRSPCWDGRGAQQYRIHDPENRGRPGDSHDKRRKRTGGHVALNSTGSEHSVRVPLS